MFQSARAIYACLALTELASRHGDSKPARLTELAEKHCIPQRFLVQILLQLKGAGLVASIRGSSGGYQLSRPPSQITLADILSVVDRAELSKERTASLENASSELHAVFRKLADAREKILIETTLADLAPQVSSADYAI